MGIGKDIGDRFVYIWVNFNINVFFIKGNFKIIEFFVIFFSIYRKLNFLVLVYNVVKIFFDIFYRYFEEEKNNDILYN